jgi:putative nucleotidyltransferase with HDIG domain
MRIAQTGYIFHLEEKTGNPVFIHSFPEDTPAPILTDNNMLIKSLKTLAPEIKNRANLDASFIHPAANQKGDNYLVTPIFLKDKCFGAILLLRFGNKNDFTSIDEKTVFAIASQSAVIIENHKLYFELKENFIKTIEALAAAIDMKDKFTIGHSKRVSRTAIAIAGELGIESEKELFDIKIGALLHDIGKIGIPSELLYKSSSPTKDEWEVIRKHPLNGEEIVKNLSGFEGIISAIKYHHERWDGQGYPHGLKGDEIPLITRIVSVSDTYDTIISRRPYKEALSSTDAFNSIITASGTQFDPEIVEAFKRAYNKGSIIKIVKN